MPGGTGGNAGTAARLGLDQPLAGKKADRLAIGGARGGNLGPEIILVRHQRASGKGAGNNSNGKPLGYLPEEGIGARAGAPAEGFVAHFWLSGEKRQGCA